MKKTISLVLVLALGLASMGLAAEHTWRQKADIPTARGYHSTSVVDGKIYAIGGAGSEPNPVVVWSVEVYDPITDSWTQKADILTGRVLLSSSVVDGKIYAIGGLTTPHPCVVTSTVYELTVSAPPPDFNGDGIVDCADMCIMVDHWGEDYPLCDIGPTPFGDGIVDVQDLIVLSEHLFEEIPPVQ